MLDAREALPAADVVRPHTGADGLAAGGGPPPAEFERLLAGLA